MIPVVTNDNSNQDNTTNKSMDVNDLEETLAWMQGKMAGIENYYYANTGALSHNFTERNKYKIEYEYSNCNIKIIDNYSYVEDRRSLRNDHEKETSYEFNLSDVSSIVVEEKWGDKQFLIKMYNNQKSVHKISKGWGNQEIDVDEIILKFSDLGDLGEESDRFIKAFNEAVNMCGGGKKEKY